MTHHLWKAPANVLFIGVDLTNDFIPPHGALAVADGDKVIPVVNQLTPHFQHVLWTKEEHDAGHDFFASSHPGKQALDTVETPYGTQFLWPDHCITGTEGAAFHRDLIVNENDMVVIKGTDKHIHAYSAVYMDDRETIIRYPDGKTLPEKIRQQQIDTIVISGLVYDFCAGLTAFDLAKDGFHVIFVTDAARSICLPAGNGKTTHDRMTEMLHEAGVILTDSTQLPHLLSGQHHDNTQNPCRPD